MRCCGMRNALRMVVLAAAAGACTSTPPARTVDRTSDRTNVGPLPAVQRFGDSTVWRITLLDFSAIEERAVIDIEPSAHLIVLAVRPGRDIELILPDETNSAAVKKRGRLALSLTRYIQGNPDANTAAEAQAEMAFERCVANAQNTAERAARARAQRRDSSGRQAATPAVSSAGAGCRKPTVARSASKRRALPPREPSERYLVVLTSSSALSVEQINTRLETLTTVAPDVATTIEAIAAGLFAGVPGTFTGLFTNW